MEYERDEYRLDRLKTPSRTDQGSTAPKQPGLIDAIMQELVGLTSIANDACDDLGSVRHRLLGSGPTAGEVSATGEQVVGHPMQAIGFQMDVLRGRLIEAREHSRALYRGV